jgi:prefoldin subunit 5
MSVDLELLAVARNYAVKVETEFKKAKEHWRRRFENLDDELQTLYRDKAELEQSFNTLHQEYKLLQQRFADQLGQQT